MPPPLLVLPGARHFRRKVQIVASASPISPIVGPVVFAASWRELHDLVQRHPASPVVVDSSFPAEHGSPPAFAIVLRLGVRDSLRAVEHAVLKGIDSERPRRLRARLRKHAADGACRIMDRILHQSFAPCRVPDLAAELRLSHRALIRRCATLGIPTPKKLIDLGRIYTVERLAEWSDQPSGVAATALGFSDSANYRRTVRRAMGAPPTVVRQRGGAACVGRAIERMLTTTGTNPTPPPDESVNN